MKKFLPILAALLACLTLLTGCIPSDTPPVDESGQLQISPRLTVEAPGEGFSLLDYSDALALSGTYYAAWSWGEGEEGVNGDGEETVFYDAQLYLLLQDCEGQEEAAQTCRDWQTREEERYEVSETSTLETGGTVWTLITYTVANEDNPYARGISAFGVWEDQALCAELACRADYPGDEAERLQTFLRGLTFTPEEG